MILATLLTLAVNVQDCTGCHAMERPARRWRMGSHARVAACRDCHSPEGAWSRWGQQATTGVRHGVRQAMGPGPGPYPLDETSRATLQAACLRCHPENLRGPLRLPLPADAIHLDPRRSCLGCHSGHRPAPLRLEAQRLEALRLAALQLP